MKLLDRVEVEVWFLIEPEVARDWIWMSESEEYREFFQRAVHAFCRKLHDYWTAQGVVVEVRADGDVHFEWNEAYLQRAEGLRGWDHDGLPGPWAGPNQQDYEDDPS